MLFLIPFRGASEVLTSPIQERPNNNLRVYDVATPGTQYPGSSASHDLSEIDAPWLRTEAELRGYVFPSRSLGTR